MMVIDGWRYCKVVIEHIRYEITNMPFIFMLMILVKRKREPG